MRGLSVLCSLLLAPGAVLAQQGKDPAFIGMVTHITAPTEFSLEGIPVLLQAGIQPEQSIPNQAPYIGQTANLWGQPAAKGTIFSASRAVLLTPAAHRVSGTGLIDQVELPENGVYHLRADGRLLAIPEALLTSSPLWVANQPSATTPNPQAPRPAAAAQAPAPAARTANAADIRTNVWIDYAGQERSDGIVEVEEARFADNGISHGEAKLRARETWDPSAVDQDAHQTVVSKAFRGLDPRQIAPYRDPEEQARIDRIGRSLVPAFQQQLDDADPVKIHFRFQLVDEPKWHDALTYSAGNILVPYQLVERLKDDSQLAAVLADNIATALEKQVYRQKGATATLSVLSAAGSGMLLISPIAGVATVLASSSAQKRMMTHAEQQSGRVALGLMRDAGYDIRQAPEAWWILASKADEDPHRKPPPPRALNQYQALGTTWQASRQQPLTRTEVQPRP